MLHLWPVVGLRCNKMDQKKLALAKKALSAADKIIANLGAADFAHYYGAQAVEGLKEYRVDMALDIYNVMVGDLLPPDIMREASK